MWNPANETVTQGTRKGHARATVWQERSGQTE